MMLTIAGGIILAVVGGWILIFVLAIVVNALRPKPKYVPYKHPKVEKIDPRSI
jgi:hypothetical protein